MRCRRIFPTARGFAVLGWPRPRRWPAKGTFAAEVIFRAEAEYLLSTDRKQQIADIYLEFADALFKPAKSDQKPDYAKAFEFYKKAIEVGPEPEKRIEVELRMAECQQNWRTIPRRLRFYEKFIKERSDEKAAEEVARRNAAAAAKTFTDDLDMPFLAGTSPAVFLTIEASFRLGECRLAAGEGNVARRVWEDLLDKYDWTKDDRIADAQFQLARTWNIPKPQSDEELNLGVSALRAFIERFPKHKLASRAHLEIAESYVERGRYDGRRGGAAAVPGQPAIPATARRPRLPEICWAGVSSCRRSTRRRSRPGATIWPSILRTRNGATCSGRSSTPSI